MQGPGIDRIVEIACIVTAFDDLKRCWRLRWIWQHAGPAGKRRDKSAGGVCRWHDQPSL